MFSRYRSYTCYSEEDGKLVPSIEPTIVKEVSQNEKGKEKITKENKSDIKQGSSKNSKNSENSETENNIK